MLGPDFEVGSMIRNCRLTSIGTFCVMPSKGKEIDDEFEASFGTRTHSVD